jgi:hypothetical protein
MTVAPHSDRCKLPAISLPRRCVIAGRPDANSTATLSGISDFASLPFRLFVVVLAWKELCYDHCLSRAANPIASSALDA